LEIANNFNNFFSSIGKSISDSVNETNVKAESLVPEGDVPEFELGSMDQSSIVNTLKLLKSKTSTDIEGLSVNLLRSVATEISLPLTHIFNLSLSQGVFPTKLKQAKLNQSLSQGILTYVTKITVQ